MRTIGTQKSMSKINLLPKVEEISEVQEIIPKKWRNKFFFGKLNRLFPTTEEQIQQDHEIEELPLPNHEKLWSTLIKLKLHLNYNFLMVVK